MVPIGHVALAKRGAKISTLYTTESNQTLLIVRHIDIASELAYVYADLFSTFTAAHTIVMGEYNLIAYTGAGEESELRKVSSTRCGITDAVPQLESEHVVTGVAAALLNYAEARGKSAVLYSTLSRAYLTVPAMRAFEPVAAVLQSLTGAAITAPAVSTYATMLKRDPYVLKTENMYS
jgi:predicted ATP-grasp superfamily ATP-dependent carboligase